MPQRFALGRVVATPAALAVLENAGVSPLPYLARHAAGDWGEVDPDDKRANDDALVSGARLFSAYTVSGTDRLWVITDAAVERGERPVTTLLLPDDY